MSPPSTTGVGVVFNELPDIRQSSSPVLGSYPNMVPAPFVISSVRSAPAWTVGVENAEIRSRAVRQTSSPVAMSKAAMKEPSCWSACTITRFSQMIGELAAAHW